MISEKLEPLWNWAKASLWKIACGLLGLICLILLLGYFSQGGDLANTALNNAQRLILPLKPEGEWIGTRVKVEVAQDKKEVQDEVTIAPIQTEAAIPAEGQVADLTGAVPEHALPADAEATDSGTEVVITEALESEVAAQEPDPVEQQVRDPLPKRAPGKPLAAAPTAEFNEKVGEFLVPKISDDGTKPWQYYGKSFEDEGGPIVAVIVRGLGLGRLTTENVLNLDSHVTLSFSPYAKNAQMWGSHARNIGHEVLIDLPQESMDYPAHDPGPYALLNKLEGEENKQRIFWVMSRMPGYVGFLQNDNPSLQSGSIREAFAEVANRGLFVIEAPVEKTESLTKHQEQMGLITHPYTRRLDEVLSEEDIQKQLDLLVKDAKANGTAIAVARPYPLTLELLDQWTQELGAMGVKLAPVSAVIARDF